MCASGSIYFNLNNVILYEEKRGFRNFKSVDQGGQIDIFINKQNSIKIQIFQFAGAVLGETPSSPE